MGPILHNEDLRCLGLQSQVNQRADDLRVGRHAGLGRHSDNEIRFDHHLPPRHDYCGPLATRLHGPSRRGVRISQLAYTHSVCGRGSQSQASRQPRQPTPEQLQKAPPRDAGCSAEILPFRSGHLPILSRLPC